CWQMVQWQNARANGCASMAKRLFWHSQPPDCFK
ncbi:MAG: hypothetical protein ACI91G_001712, partial [Gammaproteobacteria bacterium]